MVISEKTRDFVPRKWVFDEIDNWLDGNYSNNNKEEYFIITGKAGSGKSTAVRKHTLDIRVDQTSSYANTIGKSVVV